MNRYEIIFEGRIVSSDDEHLTTDTVERFVDQSVAELEKINAEDIDVSTNLADCTITVSVTNEASDLFEAQVRGNTAIRTAFHAAGAGTSGWSIDWTEAKTMPESDSHPEVTWETASV